MDISHVRYLPQHEATSTGVGFLIYYKYNIERIGNQAVRKMLFFLKTVYTKPNLKDEMYCLTPWRKVRLSLGNGMKLKFFT